MYINDDLYNQEIADIEGKLKIAEAVIEAQKQVLQGQKDEIKLLEKLLAKALKEYVR